VELMVKLQLEGYSRIGLKYAQEYQAVKSYEELISKQEGNAFSLKLELVKDKLNLSLVSENTGIRTDYKDILYSPEQIKKIFIGIDLSKDFQFLHTYSKNNMLMVAKPFRSQTFIILSKIEITNPVNL
jgi:hypothetical protein